MRGAGDYEWLLPWRLGMVSAGTASMCDRSLGDTFMLNNQSRRTQQCAVNQPVQDKRRVYVASAALFTALWSVCDVGAIGLDNVVQQSALGEPLRIVIPLILGSDDDAVARELSGECFRLVAPESDLPHVLHGRATLERNAHGARLVVKTSRPVNEPAVAVAIRAGCHASVRREYTILLDPRPVDVPAIEEAVPTQQAVAPPAMRDTVIEPAKATETASRPAEKRAAPRSLRAGTTGKPSNNYSTSNRAGKSFARNVSPRSELRISRGTGATGNRPEPDVDADIVVLQRRIVELTDLVQRMQQERAAQDARDAEQAAAREAELAAQQRWSNVSWSPWALLGVLIALLIARWLERSRRRPSAREAMTPLDLDTEAGAYAAEAMTTSEVPIAGAMNAGRHPSRAGNVAQRSERAARLPERAFDLDVELDDASLLRIR